MWSGLVFVFMDGYLMLGDKIALILLLGNIVGLLSVPLWLALVHRTSKAIAWGLSISLYALLLVGGLLIQPGMSWVWSLLVVGGAYMSFVCFNVASAAMMADVADYGLLKFNKDRRATYFAISTFCYKAVMGLGAGISLGIAGYFGVDVSGTEQSDAAAFGLRLAFLLLPAVFALLAVLLLCVNPITRSRHRTIITRLRNRERRQVNTETPHVVLLGKPA
jgi:Na+/melibiose symporter-like transporter